MKPLLRLIPVLALALCSLRAADDGDLAAARAADDERVAALLAGDSARLAAVLSDELRYVHSSGHADNKVDYVNTLATHKTVYVSYDYQERHFLSCAPEVILMSGHVLMHSLHGSKNGVDLDFLAVWRNEHGAWRLLAWQSSTHPPPASPSTPTPAPSPASPATK